ncbi:type I restriction-modification system [Vibrio ishigakensis]|uniref:Type I restriction-modification system n=1 Tax=Vibrio ishigakensis TaxID=1481914 RepID=A0A0B8Q525_9VIBR|nr:type I restriction-modification system [Vibrio ishigakensis]
MGNRTLKDKDASMLDRLTSQIQTAHISGSSDIENLKADYISRLQNLAITITDVRKQGDEIARVQTQKYWDEVSLEQLEQTRTKLRGIMKFKKKEVTPYDAIQTTKAEDGEVRETDRVVVIGDETEAMVYRKRLKDILEKMLSDNPVLQKIHNNEAVTEDELKSLTSSILTQHPGVDANA